MAAKKKPKLRHNLGGVACSDKVWRNIHDKYTQERENDESFANWVRRKLQS